MLLNSDTVKKYLRGVVDNSLQQVSVDLTLKDIKKVFGGYIFKNKKSIQPYLEVPFDKQIPHGDIWTLEEGTYSITFDQNCSIPATKTGMILHKSSLVRIGGTLDCGIYDPGYVSEGGMGAILTVGKHCNINLQKGSAIATFYMFENERVGRDKLYNGSYQKDKDIK